MCEAAVKRLYIIISSSEMLLTIEFSLCVYIIWCDIRHCFLLPYRVNE